MVIFHSFLYVYHRDPEGNYSMRQGLPSPGRWWPDAVPSCADPWALPLKVRPQPWIPSSRTWTFLVEPFGFFGGFWRTPWLQLYIQYLIYLFFGWFSEVRVVQGQIVVGTCWNLMNNCRKPWFAIYLGLVLQATTIFQTLATLMLLHGQVRSCSTCRPSGNST